MLCWPQGSGWECPGLKLLAQQNRRKIIAFIREHNVSYDYTNKYMWGLSNSGIYIYIYISIIARNRQDHYRGDRPLFFFFFLFFFSHYVTIWIALGHTGSFLYSRMQETFIQGRKSSNKTDEKGRKKTLNEHSASPVATSLLQKEVQGF